jgi:hypothetical protein
VSRRLKHSIKLLGSITLLIWNDTNFNFSASNFNSYLRKANEMAACSRFPVCKRFERWTFKRFLEENKSKIKVRKTTEDMTVFKTCFMGKKNKKSLKVYRQKS